MIRPAFFEPMPSPVKSILGKRSQEKAFGSGMNDRERYNQEIPPDFFETNQSNDYISTSTKREYINKIYKYKLKCWREKYNSKY